MTRANELPAPGHLSYGPSESQAAEQLAIPLDTRIIQLWLQGMAATTQAAYMKDIAAFLDFTGERILSTRYADLADYVIWLERRGYMDRTRRRMIAAVKSLLKFAHAQGWCPVNVGLGIRLPRVEDDLDERLIDQESVLHMLESEPSLRNLAVLVILYYGGLRIGELGALCWRHIQFNAEAGCTLKVRGKGRRTRFVALGEFETGILQQWLGECQHKAPENRVVPLCTRQINRLVAAAGRRIAAPRKISPHMLRHAHASHSQDNGERPHVVQRTLGHSDLRMTTHYSHIRHGVGSGRSLARPARLAATSTGATGGVAECVEYVDQAGLATARTSK